MLLAVGCTVTIAHSRTRNLPAVARRSDIIVAASGIPRLVKGTWVKDGAVVIDVGITRVMGENGKERLVGDVAFDEVQHAKAVTPVPGGVGPMTIACLLHNTVQAAKVLSNSPARETGDPFHDAPDRSLIYGAGEGASVE
jgi:methylenetetrahydrofolate dehydrogenase (NADP+)/methenyltetrahydrofolate cyclohydrolase